jgi:hypothetical protein
VKLALATLLALLVPVAAAHAGTVANRTPQAGPALAGPRVAWGERARDGSLQILRGATRQRVTTLAPPSAPRTRGDFLRTPSAFAASADAFAAVVLTATSRRHGGDAHSTRVTAGVVGGPWAQPDVLAGAIPPRGDWPCQPGAGVPAAVDTDGPRVAIAERLPDCAGAEDVRVRIAGPDGERVVPLGAGPARPTNVAIRGHYLAWTLARGAATTLTVLDLDTDTTVFSTSTRRLRAAVIGDLALDDDGGVAFTYAGPRLSPRLAWAPPRAGRLRVFASGVAERGVAIDGGWLLYEQGLRGDRSELRLRHVTGARPRRLAGFGPGHRRAGDIDIDATRATWAVGGRAARIVVRTR